MTHYTIGISSTKIYRLRRVKSAIKTAAWLLILAASIAILTNNLYLAESMSSEAVELLNKNKEN